MSYAITLVKDNTEKVLAYFANMTDAMKAGPSYREQYTKDQGLVACVSAEFDDADHITGSYRFHGAWQ